MNHSSRTCFPKTCWQLLPQKMENSGQCMICSLKFIFVTPRSLNTHIFNTQDWGVQNIKKSNRAHTKHPPFLSIFRLFLPCQSWGLNCQFLSHLTQLSLCGMLASLVPCRTPDSLSLFLGSRKPVLNCYWIHCLLKCLLVVFVLASENSWHFDPLKTSEIRLSNT